jgi:hypothetical protein
VGSDRNGTAGAKRVPNRGVCLGHEEAEITEPVIRGGGPCNDLAQSSVLTRFWSSVLSIGWYSVPQPRGLFPSRSPAD